MPAEPEVYDVLSRVEARSFVWGKRDKQVKVLASFSVRKVFTQFTVIAI